MVQIRDVYEKAVSLLISQFKATNPSGSRNNMEKLFYALSVSFQYLEDTLWQLQNERSLETAIGVQLDGLGEILGLSRVSGQSDEEYRQALIFQSYINSSSGTAEQCLNALQFFTKASKVWYFDMFPAGFKMATNGLFFPPTKTDLCSAMNRIKPAGVSSVPIILTLNVTPFELSMIEYEAFHVSPDFGTSEQLQVNGDNLYVNAGKVQLPEFGGTLAYFDSDENLVTEGAGQLCGLLQV